MDEGVLLFWVLWGSSMFISLLFIGLGLTLHKSNIKRNSVFGYRTRESMQNDETWTYANKFFGKYLFFTGIVDLIITVTISIILFLTVNIETTPIFVVGIVFLLLVCCSIFVPVAKVRKGLEKINLK